MKNPTSRTQTLARVSTLAAVATAATGAHAAIVFNSSSITSNDTTRGTTSWNIDGTGVAEVGLKNLNRGGGGAVFYKSLGASGGFRAVTNARRLNGLAASVPISTAQQFGSVSIYQIFKQNQFRAVTNFVSGASTYIGFEFNPSGTMLYGWANVTLTKSGGYGTFTINNWAYDDTGASILTGQTVATPVPEPASYAVGLGALALGAAALRRRRQTRAVAA
jgi:MYXO-CTERM domain-containing protein